MLLKFKKQKINTIEKTHPDLYKTIQDSLAALSDEDKGIVAGLIIEAVIKSDGDESILQEELDFDPDEDWDESDEV